MRPSPRGWILGGLLSAISAVAVGCGSSGGSTLLREADAAGLKDTLGQVRAAVDAGDCSKAGARLTELRSDVGNLPGSVDRELRRRLREEIVGKLKPAVERECDAPKTEALPTVTTEAPAGPTEPAPSKPTVTKTTTTPPPTDTAEPTVTIPPPSDTTPPPTDTTPTPEVPKADPGGFGANGGAGPRK